MNELESPDMVTLFQGMSDEKPVQVSMQHIYNLIIGDTLKDATEKFRYFQSAGLTKDADKEKRSISNFTPSVICESGHGKKNVIAYTRRGMSDMDHVPIDRIPSIMTLLKADPYVEIAHITLSGTGIRIIYRTDVTDIAQHKYVFEQGNAYYSKLVDFPSDPKCKNANRNSALCTDKNCFYNPNAQTMHIEIPAENQKKIGRPRKVYSAPVLQAETAILNELDRQGKKYVEGRYNEYVSTALYLMNGYGVPQGDALAWAVSRFSDYETSQVESIARSVYQCTEEHGSRALPKAQTDDSPESYYASIEEIETFIATQARIRVNLLTRRREILLEEEEEFRYITDNDENTLWLRAKKAGVHTSNQIFTCILNSEFIGSYHPFMFYIEQHPLWDGTTDYIAQVANMVHTDCQEYFNRLFKKWFVGVVASLLNPVVVNNAILTLIGAEGIYKTTFFNRLLPPELRSYFCCRMGVSRINKDDIISIAESMLTCLEEIDNMTINDLNQIKAMVTLPEVNERAAYARNKEYRPHNTSFCATGNNLYFLPSDEENRRWLSAHVKDIDDPYTHPIPYEGLYAQAVALYHSGFRYWFNNEEMIELRKHNEQFLEPNLEEDLIQEHYRTPLSGETPRFISIAAIMIHIGLGLRYNLSKTKIGHAMDRMGFQRDRRTFSRGFLVMELTSQEKIDRQYIRKKKNSNDNSQLSL